MLTEEIRKAEAAILQYEQEKHFKRLIAALRKDKVLDKDSCSVAIAKLNPILDNGLIRVGGRIDLAPVSYDQKHPIILPYKSHATDLIIACHHEKVGHSGVGHTISSLWKRFWIVKIGVAVRSVLGSCLFCKRRAATSCSQLMADLPLARLQVNQPAFSHVGVDYFGPFLIKQGRSEVKRHGCLFTFYRQELYIWKLRTTFLQTASLTVCAGLLGGEGNHCTYTATMALNSPEQKRCCECRLKSGTSR